MQLPDLLALACRLLHPRLPLHHHPRLLFEEMAEVAKSLEPNTVSLKAANIRTKGMVNSASTHTCQKSKSEQHATQDCHSDHCNYCKQWFHTSDRCFVNPQASSFKGDDFAKQYWAKAGKKPPAPGEQPETVQNLA